MSYQITTTHNFVIDGAETNAGERAFAKDAHVVVIDGETAGSSGKRQFLKDHRNFVISGGHKDKPGIALLYTTCAAITGRSIPGGMTAHPMSTVIIDGRPGYHPVVRTPHLAFFEIATVPQETPP